MEWASLSRSWPPIWTIGKRPRRILFSKAWISRLAWARRPRFLRHCHQSRKPVLFAGPWVGEFGWELMNWQGYLRSLRPFYPRIIVSSRASSEALYRDICDEFISHGIRGDANAHVVCDVENPEELQRVLSQIPEDADHLPPLRYVPLKAQAFARLGHAEQCPEPQDVLIHARGRDYVVDRNWPLSKWIRFVETLQAQGISVGCIGLSSDTLDVPCGKNFRDLPLGEVMDLMSSARLVVGPSSGPLHLASLCGTPHLVWTDRKTYGMGKTSREKFETWWNPLHTPVSVLDAYGFDPRFEIVLNETLLLLAS